MLGYVGFGKVTFNLLSSIPVTLGFKNSRNFGIHLERRGAREL
jgi:hypothetical protein